MRQLFPSTEEGSRPRLSKSAFGTTPPVKGKAVPNALLRGGRLGDVVSRLKRVHVMCETSLGGIVAVEGWVRGDKRQRVMCCCCARPRRGRHRNDASATPLFAFTVTESSDPN